MSLRLKFNLVLLIALGAGYALIGYFLWGFLAQNARDEVLSKAQVMRQSALAMRSYTADEIRPLLQTISQDRFLPHTVPSYAAQENFRRVSEAFGEYSYKEAALNPTNPSDRASDWEADIIRAFRDGVAGDEVVIERQTPLGPSLVLAHPIKITNEACLQCHSTPDAAPPSMVALYGEANGFGWELNEIIGAQIVSVPMSVPLERARETFMVVMISMAVVFVVMLLIINVLLGMVVIRPIARLSDLATEISLGNLDAPEMKPRGGGEIASLTEAFNRMRRSLENALRMIE
jgi:protein-histidine pros-kinase